MNEEAPLITTDTLDMVFMTRLMTEPPESYPLSPFQYLLGCFARCSDEIRTREVSQSPELMAAVQACKELVINYARTALGGGGVIQQARFLGLSAHNESTLDILS